MRQAAQCLANSGRTAPERAREHSFRGYAVADLVLRRQNSLAQLVVKCGTVLSLYDFFRLHCHTQYCINQLKCKPIFQLFFVGSS
jgi:hypothetical protein